MKPITVNGNNYKLVRKGQEVGYCFGCTFRNSEKCPKNELGYLLCVPPEDPANNYMFQSMPSSQIANFFTE